METKVTGTYKGENMIKRYGWANGMEQFDDGPWVKFEDVQELEAHCGAFSRKVASLEADKRELVEMLKVILEDKRAMRSLELNRNADKLSALIAKHKEGV